MQHLSWILRHGIAAWTAGLFAATLAGLLPWRRRLDRLAAREAAAALARAGNPTPMASKRPPRPTAASWTRRTAFGAVPAAAFVLGSTLAGEIALRRVHDAAHREANARSSEIADVVRWQAREPFREIASLLALEKELGASVPAPSAPDASCPPRAPEDPALLADPIDLFFNPPLGAPGLSLGVLATLERSVSSHAAPCARRMQVAVPVAAFEALAGDPAEALRVAQLVVDHAPAGDRARASAFAAAVMLYAGDPEQARERIAALPADTLHLSELRWLAAVATGRPAEPIAMGRGTPFHGMEAWLAGDLRSGRRLAVLAQGYPAPLGVVRLAARKIDGGQEALREWLRWGDKHDLWGPTSIAVTMAQLRDVAEAAGEPALARDHEATRHAFHEALSRRDITVRLALLDHL